MFELTPCEVYRYRYTALSLQLFEFVFKELCERHRHNFVAFRTSSPIERPMKFEELETDIGVMLAPIEAILDWKVLKREIETNIIVEGYYREISKFARSKTRC